MDGYKERIKKIIISDEEIKAAVKKAGKKIDQLYNGEPILLVSILKGSFIFLADLCRAVTVPCEIGFMRAQSYYDGTKSSGKVSITMDLEQNLSKYHVIIVEDIIDTGKTLNEIIEIIRSKNPLSINIITLLDKPTRREVELKPDMALFTIPDIFVIGYGLDCGEHYRNLPYIAEFCSD